jgi:hypothetical protein
MTLKLGNRLYRMFALLSGGRINGNQFISFQNNSQGHQRGARLVRTNSGHFQRRFRRNARTDSPPVQVVAKLRCAGRDRSDFRVHSADSFARKQSTSGKRIHPAGTRRSLFRRNRKNRNVSCGLSNFFRL